MNIRLFCSLLLGIMLCAFISGAQTFTIKGKVTDTLNSADLPNASVVLMHAKDSVMETFTRTRQDGSFELHPKAKGNYIIMITFPSFADYLDEVKMEDRDLVDMGSIIMLSRENLLSEFVLHANKGAIRIKGDTIEYVADSFKMKDNASVEELLKKLPGLQVNKNGEITAQGEKVQKILVDGEEFFSDDPAVVTKNLQANAIDKVQVFDRKSEQAEFTGIDDGEKIKTINLELKEDKKKGIFGKAVAGGGTDGYFENQAMINQFKGKRQLSAFGIAANTGKIGLGWEDKDKYGGGSGGNIEMNDDGDITQYWNGNSDEFESWNGTYNGQGQPKAWTGGLHFADKWQRDTNHVATNYRFAKQNIETTGKTVTQYVLPGSGLNKYEDKNSFSTGIRHKVDGLYERKLDSLSTLKVTASGSYSRTQTTSDYEARNFSSQIDSVTGEPILVNMNTRTGSSDVNSKGQNAELIYKKKFMKKGRSLIVNFSESYKETDGKDATLSNISSFADATPLSIPLNQRRENYTTAFNLNGKVNYTEPLSKVTFLELNYSLNMNNSEVIRNTYSIRTDNTDTLNPFLSTNYAYDILTNTGGANFRFVKKKINLALGGSVANADFKQTDRRTDTLTKFNMEYSRLNFFPRATFNYKIGQQTSFNLSYNGATNQPTIDQIQPVRNNNDPLNIAVGNPNLKQEFRHTVSGRFNDYKVLTGRYIWSNVSFSAVQSDITMVDNIDPNGIRTYSYQNVNGNYTAWGYLGYGFRLQDLDLDLGASVNGGINHSNTFVNGLKNVSDNNNYGFGLDFRKDEDNKYSVSYRPEFNYNSNKATISNNTSSYWTQEHNLDLEVQLPLKFEVGSEVQWFIRQTTPIFTTNNNVFRWNAYVSKKFLKKSQLELRAYVFDILNQNRGFQRVAQGNMITENNYNTVTQYGMLSLIWNFSKMAAGAAPANEGSGMQIKL
jgi:hypothetical protein